MDLFIIVWIQYLTFFLFISLNNLPEITDKITIMSFLLPFITSTATITPLSSPLHIGMLFNKKSV